MLSFIMESNLFYIILIVIAILITGVVYVRRLSSEKDRKLELIIGLSAGVSIILVMFNLILTTHSNNRIEENRIAHNTLENIQRNWLSPQIDLSKNYPEGFFLYRSMTPDADYGTEEPLAYDAAKRKQIEIATSIRVFQAMEDYLTIGSHDLTGNNVWINNFLMWIQSPILRNNWKSLSFNYSLDTRKLVERLIIESEKLNLIRQQKGFLTNKDYDEISSNFIIKFR